MSDYDRWRNDNERYRGRDERDRGGYGGGGRYETDYDHDRAGRGGYGESFGRGSRDYSAAGTSDRSRPTSYPFEDRGYGRSSEWRDDQRGNFGREGGSAGFGWGGQDHEWRSRPDVAGRSVSDLAFGRDASGRDSGRGGDYGRRNDRDDRGFFERAGDEVASWFGDEDAERRRRQDAREDERYGEHRGRGPKSYQRSDERIRDDLNDRLTDDHRLDASEITVEVKDREVTLTGTVNGRNDKRRAEDLAENVSGVTHVQNNLRVQNQSTSGSSWSDSSASGYSDSTSRAASATAGQRSVPGSNYETSGAEAAAGRGSARTTSKA